YTVKFLLIWAGIMIVVTVLDYLIPLYGTRRFGGSKYGEWGCAIGPLAGICFPPWGIIAGPLVGAFVGVRLGNDESDRARPASIGAFIGFLFGTLLKLITCFVMGWYLIKPWFQ